MSKALKQLAGQTVIYGVSSILSRVLNYVVIAGYLTRVISRSEYGTYSEMYFYVAILMSILVFRMDTALFRYGREEGKLGITFSTALIFLVASTLTISSIFYLNADTIARWLSYDGHEHYIKILIGVIAFDVISSIAFAKLRLQNRPIKFAALKTLNVVINIIVLFLYLDAIPYLIDHGYNWLSNYYNSNKQLDYVFIANIVASFVTFLFLMPDFFSVQLKFDKILWKKMIVYSLPLILVTVAAIINQSGAVVLQKYVLSGDIKENLSTGGVYSASAKIAILMNLFTFAFNYAAEPFFFSHAEKSDSKQIYSQVSQAFALVASIIFLGILLYLDLIQLIVGKDFRSGLAVVPILLIAYLFLGLYYNFSIWYKLTDKTIYGAGIAWGGAIITLFINIFFLAKYGYMASAWAALACYGFMALAAYLLGQKYYPIAYPIKKISLYISLAVATFYLSYWLNNFDNIWIKMIVNTGFLLMYVSIIFLIDKKSILRLFHKKK